MNLMLTPSPPVLTPQLPVRLASRFNQEHLNNPTVSLASLPGPTNLQMLLRDSGPNTRRKADIVYQPSPPQTSLIGSIPPPLWKSLRP
jgi:hypothetical protein